MKKARAGLSLHPNPSDGVFVRHNGAYPGRRNQRGRQAAGSGWTSLRKLFTPWRYAWRGTQSEPAMFEWINSVSIVTMITAIVLLDQPFQGAVRLSPDAYELVYDRMMKQ
jgi:hypothetical protein